MLTSHPDLALPAESYFIVSMNRRASDTGTAKGFRLDLYMADLGQHPWFRQWDLPIASVADQLSSQRPILRLSDAIRGTFASYARAHGKDRYADKTPPYVLNIPAISNMFPELAIHSSRSRRT